jgi:hypothetical protein
LAVAIVFLSHVDMAARVDALFLLCFIPLAAGVSPKCQAAADAYCNIPTTCLNAMKAHHVGCIGPMFARFDAKSGESKKQWRCYDITSLSPDSNHSHYNGNSTCYCSHSGAIEDVLNNCETPTPAPAPTPATVSSNPFISGKDGYHTYRIPSLVQLENGNLLLFAEGRKFSSSDHDWNDIVMKRSTDSGRTWGAMSIVHSESTPSHHITIGNPAPIVVTAGGTIGGRGNAGGHIVLTGCRNNTDVFQMVSTDSGATWSNVSYFTQQVVPTTPYSHVATGPPGGTQLSSGESTAPSVVTRLATCRQVSQRLQVL